MTTARFRFAALSLLLAATLLAATGCNTTSEQRIEAARKGVEFAEQRYNELDAALDAIDETIETLQVRLAEAEPDSELFKTLNAKIDQLQQATEREELVEARALARQSLVSAREALAEAKENPGVASEMDVVGDVAGSLSAIGGPVGVGFGLLSGVLGTVAEFFRRRKKEGDDAMTEAAENANLGKLSPKAKKTIRKASGKQV